MLGMVVWLMVGTSSAGLDLMDNMRSMVYLQNTLNRGLLGLVLVLQPC